jgi:hypothetical protein
MTLGTEKSSNGKGGHVHRELLINHFKDSKTTRREILQIEINF